jgi:small subunit ribosomal protein S1
MSEETKQYQFTPDDEVTLDQLNDDLEYTPEEFAEFEEMIGQTLSELRENEVVSGKIIRIGKQDIAVDIGFKSEGLIPVEEFKNPDELNIGDEIEVFLENVDDGSGIVVLSYKKAEFMRVWNDVVDKFNNEDVITGKCMRRIKGGMVVDVRGIDAFLPGSQIDVKAIRDFDSYIGKEMEFKIVKLNHARKNIVVSHRILIEKDLQEQRSAILAQLEKGQTREGVVKNITDFGVFIDLGGVDGLLHITDLDWGRVNHPSEVVKLDQKLEVKILDFNENKDRISLGRKQLMPHPWENIEEKFPIGKSVDGKVVSITDYGAFVELEKGIEGLIHISEMSWSQHVKHPSQMLKVGDDATVKILAIDPDDKKISLGIKQLEPDPWDGLEERFPINSIHKGKVRNLTAFGAFVELQEGIDGLVHISDLSWTKKVRHPGEVVKKGDEIKVKILDINRDERRIALGHKQVDPNPWDVVEDMYQLNSIVEAPVAKVIEKGLVLGLEFGVEGFVPINHLNGKDGKKGTDGFAEGDSLRVKVIEFDKENKKIILSERKLKNDEERAELEGYNAGSQKTTIGDISSFNLTADEETPADTEEKPKKAKAKAAAAPEEEAPAEKVTEETVSSEAKADEKPVEEAVAEVVEETPAETAEATPEEATTEVKTEEADVKAEKSADTEAKAEEVEVKAEEKPADTEAKAEEAEVKAEEKPAETEAQAEEVEEKPAKKTAKKPAAKKAAKKEAEPKAEDAPAEEAKDESPKGE